MITVLVVGFAFPLIASILGLLLFIFRIVYVIGYKIKPGSRIFGLFPFTILQFVLTAGAIAVPFLIFFKQI